MRTFVAAAILVALAVPALAQQPQAPPKCDRPEHRQFDFWIGDWRVESADGNVLGQNLVTLELNDCVLHEHWTGARGHKGESFNIFDRASGKWHQTWVSQTGHLLQLDGGRDGTSMKLEGKSKQPDGTPVLDRVTWTPLDREECRGCVRQFWEQSADGGKTWTVAFEGFYKPNGKTKGK